MTAAFSKTLLSPASLHIYADVLPPTQTKQIPPPPTMDPTETFIYRIKNNVGTLIYITTVSVFINLDIHSQ